MELNPECILIKAAQKGDQQAFATLYRSHVDRIYRYIFYRVDTAIIAEDLTADVFIHALEGLSRYECSSSPWIAWLYSIANARVVDHYRRNGRITQQEMSEEATDSVEMNWDDNIVATFTHDVIQEAIRYLNDEQRQVIIYRFIESYSLEKTAMLMGKTIGAIKTMQHRALVAMGKSIQKRGIKPDDLE